MLHNHDARYIWRQRLQHRLQRLCATRRGANHHDLLRRLHHRARAGGENCIRGELGLNHRRAPQRLQPRPGRRLHRLAEHQPRLLQKLLGPQFGLRNDIYCPVLQRPQCALRSLLCKARTNHHRNRMLTHQLLQESKPVHARHLDIQRNHIGHLVPYPVGGHKWITRRRRDLNLRIARKNLAKRLPHHCRIVHN